MVDVVEWVKGMEYMRMECAIANARARLQAVLSHAKVRQPISTRNRGDL